MFDFEEQFSPGKTVRIVATQAQQRTDQEVKRDIFDSHRHRIFSLAYYMTAHELHAESILTDTFIDAFSTATEPDAGMIDASLINRLCKYFPLHTPDEPAQAAVGATLASRNVRRTDMEEALQELPPRERLVFLLRDVEGYVPEAIAPLLGETAQSIGKTLFSARIRMRNILSEMAGRREAA